MPFKYKNIGKVNKILSGIGENSLLFIRINLSQGLFREITPLSNEQLLLQIENIIPLLVEQVNPQIEIRELLHGIFQYRIVQK